MGGQGEVTSNCILKKRFMRQMMICLLLCTVIHGAVLEQATIKVESQSNLGPVVHDWAFFDHDEINYTWTPEAQRLLGELDALCPVPVVMRAHNLLNSGPPEVRLKWSASNVYTEDAQGQPVYDWTVIDRIFDVYQAHSVRPLVELGFMPQALTSHTGPYARNWPHTQREGWSYPPKDYQKWGTLIHEVTRHLVSRYDRDTVAQWYFELWNEPDIGFWAGSAKEFHRLYDVSVDAVRRALPEALVGGPHSTGPQHEKSANFLRHFLEHALHGKNYVTGKRGSPLDFIAFHAKGRATLKEGVVHMSSQRHVWRVDWGFRIVAEFPELQGRPVILGESDPEGTAAYNTKMRPENVFRHDATYPTYLAAVNHKLRQSAEKHGINLKGILTWAFIFPDQPWFAGHRALATHTVDQPVLNYFRMAGMMSGQRLQTHSDHAVPLAEVIASGVSQQADINAIAARDDQARILTVMLWHYHDNTAPVEPAPIRLIIDQFPAQSANLRHYSINNTQTMPYTAWRAMGSPSSPTKKQIEKLQQVSQLHEVGQERIVQASHVGQIEISLSLPRPSLSLLRLAW